MKFHHSFSRNPFMNPCFHHPCFVGIHTKSIPFHGVQLLLVGSEHADLSRLRSVFCISTRIQVCFYFLVLFELIFFRCLNVWCWYPYKNITYQFSTLCNKITSWWQQTCLEMLTKMVFGWWLKHVQIAGPHLMSPKSNSRCEMKLLDVVKLWCVL